MLNFDYKVYDGSLKLLIVTTSNLARQFVDVYLSPQNIEKSSLEIGHIAQKKTKAETSIDLQRSIPAEKHEEDSIVARFFKISAHVLHCHVNDDIPSDDLNDFASVVSL